MEIGDLGLGNGSFGVLRRVCSVWSKRRVCSTTICSKKKNFEDLDQNNVVLAMSLKKNFVDADPKQRRFGQHVLKKKFTVVLGQPIFLKLN